MSGIYIFRDLLELLSGKILDSLPIPAAIDTLLGLPLPKLPQLKSYTNVLLERRRQIVPLVSVVNISNDLTSKLTAKAREGNTTVHGAICAAFAQASRQLPGEWKLKRLRMVSPINIRKAIGAGEDVAFYFGSKTILFDDLEDIPFWELARYARNEIKGNEQRESILTDYEPFQQWIYESAPEDISSTLQNKVIPRELMVSNLGRWPFEVQFGTLKLENLAGPLALSGYPGEYTIGAVTTNGSLCLSMATRSPVEDVLGIACEILHSACL